MRRLSVCVLVALAAIAATAQAHTRLVLPDGSTPQPEQRWLDESRIPTPDITITLHRETCPSLPTVQACATPGHIWEKHESCAGDFAVDCRSDLTHEVGHQVDYVMPDWIRWRFEALLHMPATPWGTLGEGGDTPREDWADYYSYCVYPDHRVWDYTDWSRHPFQHRKICRLLASA